jgi:hypothetical protein
LPRDTDAVTDAVDCQGLGGLGGMAGGFVAAGALVVDSAASVDTVATLKARQRL